MKKYFKKYVILLVVLVGLQGLIKVFAISKLQVILLNFGVELNEAIYLQNIILFNIPYLTNIIIAAIILSDILKNRIKGIPVVLLTLLSYFAGVIFFLFLINNKLSSNDK